MTHTVYISLGVNLGDRLDNLHMAVDLMRNVLEVKRLSSIYETPPWGYKDQPAFLNQVMEAVTQLPPQMLLACLKDIEKKMGRVKTITNGPRTIDLDVIFYDDLIVESPELSIPHPRLQGRGFVLVPLAELAPDFCHPHTGQTISQMMALADREGIKLFAG